MKSLLYTLLIAMSIGAFACGDKDEPGNNPPKNKINPNAIISVKAQDQNKLKASEDGVMSYEDSVKFIVRYAFEWKMTIPDAKPRRLVGEFRDTINHKFTWFGSSVIDWTGIDEATKDTIYKLGNYITSYTNIVITMGIRDDGTPYEAIPGMPGFGDPDFPPLSEQDTVAYIPNKVIFAAREKIQAAFDKGDYNRCYELFDSAYIFVPTTGERYRALMEKGEN